MRALQPATVQRMRGLNRLPSWKNVSAQASPSCNACPPGQTAGQDDLDDFCQRPYPIERLWPHRDGYRVALPAAGADDQRDGIADAGATRHNGVDLIQTHKTRSGAGILYGGVQAVDGNGRGGNRRTQTGRRAGLNCRGDSAETGTINPDQLAALCRAAAGARTAAGWSCQNISVCDQDASLAGSLLIQSEYPWSSRSERDAVRRARLSPHRDYNGAGGRPGELVRDLHSKLAGKSKHDRGRNPVNRYRRAAQRRQQLAV